MNLLTCKGQTGIQYILPDKFLAKGGEGIIYNVNGQPNIVAKIYHQNKISAEKENKLLKMVNDQPDKEILKFLAWPQDILYMNSRFVGFIMLKMVINEDLNIICEYGATAKYANMPLEDKIMIGRNICWLLDIIHKTAHSCGDLNPKNISIDPQSNEVVFMDTDSFHIRVGKKTYRCDVGLPEYLPVEIQKKMQGGSDLRTSPLPTFSHSTDNFALAIHIFRLLMNGSHPFACAIKRSKTSVPAPQPIDNILRGDFPFIMHSPNVEIPKYAPKIDILTNNLQILFKRAFIDGHRTPDVRPTPSEWYSALGEYRQNLVSCNRVAHHQYYNNLSSCPWCEIDRVINPQPKIHSTRGPSSGSQSGGTGIKPPPKKKSWFSVVLASIVGLLTLGCLIAPIIVPFAKPAWDSISGSLEFTMNSLNAQSVSQSSSNAKSSSSIEEEKSNIAINSPPAPTVVKENSQVIKQNTPQESLLKSNITQAIEHYSLGTKFLNQDEYDKAITEISKAIELNPKYKEAYNNRAVVYFKIGDTNRAVSDYERALHIDPNYELAINNLEIARSTQNRERISSGNNSTSFAKPKSPTKPVIHEKRGEYSFIIKWDDMGPNINYKLYQISNENNHVDHIEYEPTNNSYRIDNLKGNSEYYFSVTAIQNGLESDKSEALFIQTPPSLFD